jgi:hypothetical protein
MAKKTRRQKKPKRKPKKESIQKSHLIKAFAGLGVLIILVVIAGVFTHHLILRKHPIEPVVKPRVIKIPRFEIYPKKEIPPHKPILKPVPAIPKKLPKIAIIIDDIGYNKKIVDKFLGLDAVLTFSILPHSPFQSMRFSRFLYFLTALFRKALPGPPIQKGSTSCFICLWNLMNIPWLIPDRERS